jgi:WD40 repeat protein
MRILLLRYCSTDSLGEEVELRFALLPPLTLPQSFQWLTRKVSLSTISFSRVSDVLAEIELETTPTDGIACLSWSPADANHLLVGSWDSVRDFIPCGIRILLKFTQSLRLYDTQANQQRAKFDHKAAVLGACFSPSPNTVFSGGLDTWLRM